MSSSSVVDPEFSPVLSLVMDRGPEALENHRRGTHGECAPEVISHMQALMMEARKCVEKLNNNKRYLEDQEKRIMAELNEQRTSIINEMDRELHDAKQKLKAQREAQEAAQANSPSSKSSTQQHQQQQHNKKSFTASLKDNRDGQGGMPGDVDYWRAQAQDLNLVVQGRQEALKSVQARIRSISHLDEHQSRAHGVIGLLRQAEAAERQKAAEYLRQAYLIREQAGLSNNNNNNNSNNNNNNNNSSGDRSASQQQQQQQNSQNQQGGDYNENESSLAMLTEAETQGLEQIYNAIEPRLEVAKEASRLYTNRLEKLRSRLAEVETRRKQLPSLGTTSSAVSNYVATVKEECNAAMQKLGQPNTAILTILKKQHGEALARMARQGDNLMSHRLQVAELENQLRESRVNAIRSMHTTAEGTSQRIAQLRASKAAEVVNNQISGIEKECSDLRDKVVVARRM